MSNLKMDTKPPPRGMFSSRVKEIFLSLISNFSLIGAGLGLGYSAVALPYMQLPGSSVFVNIQQASWIASFSSIATPIGCIMIGPILDKFGRRISLLLLSIPLTIGWLLISVNPTLERIYLGRIATGIAAGFASVSSTVFVAEVVSPQLRGLLTIGGSIAISLGITIVYILGLILKEQWQWVAFICTLFPITSFILTFVFIPESPVWLVAKKRLADARKSLKKINNYSNTDEVDTALDELTLRFNTSSRKSISFKNSLSALLKPETYKPFFIMNMFFFFQQTSGTFVIIFYAVDVVKTTEVAVDAFVVTVFIGFTRLIFTLVSAWMSRSLGRRPTALISGTGMTISLIILTVHSYIIAQNSSDVILTQRNTEAFNSTVINVTNSTDILQQAPSASLLPIFVLLSYVLFGTLGFLTLPWSMIGEVYPDRVRGMAGGITTSIAYIINFFTIKLYPTMKTTLNMYGVFGFYCLMSLLGTIFVLIFLPETEGKTLKEIEEKFAKKRKRTGQIEEEENLQNSRLPTIVKSQNLN